MLPGLQPETTFEQVNVPIVRAFTPGDCAALDGGVLSGYVGKLEALPFIFWIRGGAVHYVPEVVLVNALDAFTDELTMVSAGIKEKADERRFSIPVSSCPLLDSHQPTKVTAKPVGGDPYRQ